MQRPVSAGVSVRVFESPVASDSITGLVDGVRYSVVVQALAGGYTADSGSDDGNRRRVSKKIDNCRKLEDADGEVSQGPRWSADRIRKSDKTRRRILESLEELLSASGIDDLSVNDIAAAAGVRRTGFYFYFPSKAVAVATLLDELYEETLFGAMQFTERMSDRTAALREAIGNLWLLWQQHRPLMLAVLDARSTDREAQLIWHRWLDRYVAPIASVISADRIAGIALPGPEPATMMRLLLAMNDSSLERMLRNMPDANEIGDELDALASIWSRAIYGADSLAINDGDVAVGGSGTLTQ